MTKSFFCFSLKMLKPHWLTELEPQEGAHAHWPAGDFPPPFKTPDRLVRRRGF